MTNSAAVSTPSRIVSTETAFQRVSSLVHLVTQWMSLVTSSAGSARNSSQVHFLGSSISPSTTNVHSGKPTRGVGPAERTGKSFTTYCPGGTRELLAVSLRLPRNPREMKDMGLVSSLTSDEFQLCRDVDAAADGLGDRAPAGVEGMRALGRLPLVLRAAGEAIPHVDALDHEHLVLQHDGAFGITGQPALARVDPARLQRATQGSSESTGGRGHHVVERGGMVGILPGGGAVVLADLIVSPEHDGFRLGRNVGAADRPALADDPHLRDVFRLIHADQISTGRALWRYAR